MAGDSCMQGDVAAVVSEDSDLIVFGCSRVFFRMDNVWRRWLAGWLAGGVVERLLFGGDGGRVCHRVTASVPDPQAGSGQEYTVANTQNLTGDLVRCVCCEAGISTCLGCGGCMLQADLGRWCREDLHKLQVARQISQQDSPPKSHVLASGHGDSVRLRLFGVAEGPRHQDRLPRSECWRLCCRRHPQPSPRRRILLPARHAHCTLHTATPVMHTQLMNRAPIPTDAAPTHTALTRPALIRWPCTVCTGYEQSFRRAQLLFRHQRGQPAPSTASANMPPPQ